MQAKAISVAIQQGTIHSCILFGTKGIWCHGCVTILRRRYISAPRIDRMLGIIP